MSVPAEPADARAEIHVRLERVGKTFPGRGRRAAPVVVLDDVSLEVRRGEVFGVIGSSGAGKSTLLRLINGLETPTSGRVYLGERELGALNERGRREARGDTGMIFQQFNLFRSRTVAGNVAYPLKVAGVGQPERDRRVARLLAFVGLLDRAHDHPERLSGGQKQRVGIARALATEPSLLLVDEATSALDPETTGEVLALLGQVNRELGVTIVIVSHELDVIRSLADRVAVLDVGRVVETGTVYDVFTRPRTTAAARLIGTDLRERPSPATLARLRSGPGGGRLVTVRVREGDGEGERAEERGGARPGLAHVFLAHQVAAEVVFGGIRELQGRPAGSLTFELSGADAAVDAALAALRADGVDVVEEPAGNA
ncbi:methionine ABC transporter (ATP-binding protein) [Frankia canadensis]|uniref:Methionine ABC transporter (ATP-binding protein) n=1 Tax=Frankia canadensis TaxID=1836972 RepID=A0A2I2KQ60_9ACTN|nr:methionine ABC transporter ATP-binding protein [Frankia canadensis]SNQ47790.1 methionine ABC transporter (ATP-binding protein) [Frankia canadensis]SOU55080.1 methionine ABC transporter (ATP-binding protein) [Frankia canadensis]